MFGTRSQKCSTSIMPPKLKHTPQKSDQSPKFQKLSTGVPEEVMDTLNSLQDSIAKMNTTLTVLTGEVSNIRAEITTIADLKQSLEFTQSKLMEAREDINNINDKLVIKETQVKTMDQQLKECKTENSFLKESILKLDVYIRRENLIFTGVPDDSKESMQECHRKIRNIFARNLLYTR